MEVFRSVCSLNPRAARREPERAQWGTREDRWEVLAVEHQSQDGDAAPLRAFSSRVLLLSLL